MTQTTRIATEHDLVAVSSPGGSPARQYRVQYQDAADPQWRLYANFPRLEQAQACIHSLTQRGCQARLVRYTISPAAA